MKKDKVKRGQLWRGCSNTEQMMMWTYTYFDSEATGPSPPGCEKLRLTLTLSSYGVQLQVLMIHQVYRTQFRVAQWKFHEEPQDDTGPEEKPLLLFEKSGSGLY